MNNDHLKGQCYVMSEVMYHLFGGKNAGWKPMRMTHEGVSHWFIQHEMGMIVDLTARQFKTMPDYRKAVGCGFLTKQPSKRAKLYLALLKPLKD